MIGIYLLAITMEILCNIVIFHSFLSISFRKGKLKYILLFIAFAGFGLLSLFPNLQILYLTAISSSLSFLLTLLLYEERVKNLIILYLPVTLTMVTWDNLLTEIIEAFHDFNDDIIADVFTRQSISHGLLFLILMVLFYFLKKKGILQKINRNIIPKPVYILSISGIFMTSLIISAIRVITQDARRKEIAFSYFSLIILSILIQIICIALLVLFYSREQYKTISEMREMFNEKQVEYYKALLSQEEDTRKFRHDIKNHIICIQDLLDTEKVEEAKEYMRELYEDIDGIVSIYDTGSDIINAILNYYSTKGRENHISFQVKGYISTKLNIPMLHLSTVVSNILSNAYEAAVKLDQDRDKTILVELRSGSKYLELSVMNPTLTDRPKIEENIITSKSDRRNHGYGIRNIKEIVKQYQGEFQLIDNTDSVTVKVILKIA